MRQQVAREQAQLDALKVSGAPDMVLKLKQRQIDALNARLAGLTAALEGATNQGKPNERTPALYQRIPQEAARTSEADGEGTLRSAAEVAASVYRPGESPSESGPGRATQQREEFVLQRWARQSGLILPKGEFDQQWEAQGKQGGGENDVYFSPDGKFAIKRNNLAFHSSYLEFFERLALHNWLFPEAKMHLIGF